MADMLRTSLLLLLLVASGCATAAPRPVAQPVTAPPVAERAALPESIRWFRVSAERRAIFLQVYRSASNHVRELAAQRAPGTWAVILDADETLLDNSSYQMRRATLGLGFTIETWNEWVREAQATALPGAAAILALVRQLGGLSAVVTNRDEVVCPDTRRNMEAIGLTADIVLCRVNGQSDKNPRFQAVQQGTAASGIGPLEVVAWIGDNILDFPSLSQAVRDGQDSGFALFGRTYFMLPNPMYGSWERLPVP
jgi:5'-nucleotidase (lipoprotein e(P4) family)